MQKAPLSVRIIYFFSTIATWLLLVVTVVVFIFNGLLQLSVIGDGEFELRTSLPINFDVREVGSVELWSESRKIKIVEATGSMEILDPPASFTKMIASGLFVILLVSLFMVWKFRLFIINIKKGIIFDTSNINNLKHIAYGLIITFILTRVYNAILYFTITKAIEFESIISQGIRKDESALLISALLLWVLAHIFMKGMEMKKEQELTI